VFGVEKDVEKKESPYMVPYDALTEEIKELDRDTIRNIIPLVETVGLRVYRIASEDTVCTPCQSETAG
jgi:hypothetical protein